MGQRRATHSPIYQLAISGSPSLVLDKRDYFSGTFCYLFPWLPSLPGAKPPHLWACFQNGRNSHFKHNLCFVLFCFFSSGTFLKSFIFKILFKNSTNGNKQFQQQASFCCLQTAKSNCTGAALAWFRLGYLGVWLELVEVFFFFNGATKRFLKQGNKKETSTRGLFSPFSSVATHHSCYASFPGTWWILKCYWK